MTFYWDMDNASSNMPRIYKKNPDLTYIMQKYTTKIVLQGRYKKNDWIVELITPCGISMRKNKRKDVAIAELLKECRLFLDGRSVAEEEKDYNTDDSISTDWLLSEERLPQSLRHLQ